MPEIVENDTALLCLSYYNSKFQDVTAAILAFGFKMIPTHHSSRSVMPNLLRNDISFVCLGHLVPELMKVMSSKMVKVAILDLEVKMVPKPYNYHSSVFVMPDIVEKDISFVRLGHLVPELLQFMFFKMASGGHIGLRGQDGPQTLLLPLQCIFYARYSGKGHLICPSRLSGARAVTSYVFQDGVGGHIGFRGQDGPKTLQLPLQCICHARYSGKGHLICPSRSSGARAITFYVFQDGVGGHFEYSAIKKVPIKFQRFIGANFSFKWFLKSNPSRKKGSKKMVTESKDMTLLIMSTG